MERTDHLYLYEEVLLLALRDEKGSILFGVNYQQALAGALLADLLLMNKIQIETIRKKKFVKLLNRRHTGNSLLDECMDKMAKAKRRARPISWIQRFANISRIKHKAAQSLCRKRILKLEEDKVLLIFNRKLYPEVNAEPEKKLMQKLESAIFGTGNEFEPATIILISICNSTGILRQIFDKRKLREKKARIKEITSGNLIGKATKEAVEAMQAAVMVAAIIPSVTVATVSS